MNLFEVNTYLAAFKPLFHIPNSQSNPPPFNPSISPPLFSCHTPPLAGGIQLATATTTARHGIGGAAKVE
jgi:hypothetical protein